MKITNEEQGNSPKRIGEKRQRNAAERREIPPERCRVKWREQHEEEERNRA